MLFMLSLEVLFFWLFGALHMIPHLCFGYAVIRESQPKDSPATVLLRHRLGRRVAAEAGPATMLLRYR